MAVSSRQRFVFANRLVGRWLVPVFAISIISGCASVTSKLSSVASVTNDAPRQAIQPLGNPSDQTLQIALETAKLAEQRGMDNEAISAYLSVRRQQPDHPGLAHSLAVLYDRTGRVDDAAAEYARALNEDPRNADLHCDHGYFLYSTRQMENAEASYRRALAIVPDHRQTKVNLALLLAQQGKDDEAMTLFSDAIGPAAARHNLGMIKLRLGDRRAAEELLAEAAARDPSVAKRSAGVLASLASAPADDADSTIHR